MGKDGFWISLFVVPSHLPSKSDSLATECPGSNEPKPLQCLPHLPAGVHLPLEVHLPAGVPIVCVPAGSNFRIWKQVADSLGLLDFHCLPRESHVPYLSQYFCL